MNLNKDAEALAAALTARLEATLSQPRSEMPALFNWWSLSQMSAELAAHGLKLSPITLRRYASGKGEPAIPREGVHLSGDQTYYISPEAAIKWADKYKAAKKLGRRGDGSARKPRKGK